jgi:hypothetical protein
MSLLSVATRRYYILISLILFCITFAVYYFTGEGAPTPFHYFVPLADAFLHGRLYLTHNYPWLNELLDVNGRYYVIYPPMPAILLLPQVAIFGIHANQTLASVFWGSINVSLVYLIMRKITENRNLQIWIAILFGFGTIHWYLASVGKAWFFAQVAAFFFLSMAVYSTFSYKSSFIVGILLGASFWCRLTTVLTLPFFIIMLSDKWLTRPNGSSLFRRIKFRPLFGLAGGVGIFILLNFAYNYLRFGTFADIAYSIQSEKEPWWYPKGLFDFSYIPLHLKIFFLKPPVFTSHPPYVMPSFQGMSILITTPAFIYAVFAGIRNRLSLACWAAILPVALVLFTHGGTGWMMFGYRYALDFYPFLLILTALGMNSRIGGDFGLNWLQKLLILVSILVNLWGVLWINKFGWVSLWD